jgi:tetratricopeptide (TPR) repeat protein
MKSLETAREMHEIGNFEGIVNLAQSLGFQESAKTFPANEQAELFFLVGKSNFALGDFDQAEDFLLQAKKILDKLFKQEDIYNQSPPDIPNLGLFIQVTSYLGVFYLSTGNAEEGVRQLTLATSAFEANSDPQLRNLSAQAYYHLANALVLLATVDKYREALIAASHAVELYEGDELNIGNALLQQGIICNYLKQFEEAEAVLKLAIAQLTDLQEKESEKENLLIADAKHQLSIALLKQSKPEKLKEAIEILQGVLKSFLNAGNEKNIADIVSTQFLLGICYLKKGESKTAEYYLQASLDIFNQPQLPIEELKSALALVKWVAQDEKSLKGPSFYQKQYTIQLKNILKAIKRLEAQADREAQESIDNNKAAKFP